MFFYPGFRFDSLYLVLLGTILLSLIVNWVVKSTYSKYADVRSLRGITGAMAARRILDSHGLQNVPVSSIPGTLTDYYDPRSNQVCLGEDEYSSTSPVAIGVACHECGHAIQYAEHYGPAKLRTAIVSATNIGSQLSWPLILAGIILSRLIPFLRVLVYVGIGMFALAVIFQLITLPVEFDASRRAMEAIRSNGMLTDEECVMARKVLTAAALTYVAALAVSVVQLLRMIAIYGRGRDD